MLAQAGKRKGGLCGSTLKTAAVVSMLIDHTAAVVLTRYLYAHGETPALSMVLEGGTSDRYAVIRICIVIMRLLIGRMAFPLFVFLLTEGFYHTRSRWRYAVRLGLFALLSEIPFDLAFNKSVLEFQSQNVFFTLLIGFCTIWAMEALQNRFRKEVKEKPSRQKAFLWGASMMLTAAAGTGAAALLRTDYSMAGVLAIVFVYLIGRVSRVEGQLFGCLLLTAYTVSEAAAFLTVPLVAAYNGKRGLFLKYFFYCFYPAHLLLLWGICAAMGI